MAAASCLAYPPQVLEWFCARQAAARRITGARHDWSSSEVSDTEPSAGGGASIARLPVDKPQVAVDFLHARGGGVMDLIAHFWDRLP